MAPPKDFKSRPVTILGGGVLGRRMATVWAAGGHDVRIRDPSPEQRNAALHYIENNVAQYAEKRTNYIVEHLQDENQTNSTNGNTTPKPGKASVYEDLAEAVKGAWTIIEAVPENIELKKDTFLDLERLTEKDAILATNSSSFKSREMVGELKDETKGRVMNTHYMMPPDARIVELMTDGHTDPELFPFYVERLRECGMHPYVAQKESTGFIFNRIWAAIKREVLSVLAEGVSTPAEIDEIWKELFHSPAGPCTMMDGVGLDTVQFIEQHYIKERGLSGQNTVDWLQKEFISQGKLGAKSAKGGLYPAGYTTKTAGEDQYHHHNLHAPTLYMLDIGLNTLEDTVHAGRVLVGSPDGKKLRALVNHQSLPDGLDISLKTGRIYWTNMGESPSGNDGTVQSCKLDGSDIQTVIPKGAVHTPKQLIIDQETNKLYFCDREGLRVMRCNLDGSEHETIVQAGDWRKKEDAEDQLKWCVGISIDRKGEKFYWTQKGLSKGCKGRIFRANIDMPTGESASNRSDIELLFSGLPEPIDLEVDEDTKTLFWTDRGDPPLGNSLNSIQLSEVKSLMDGEKNPKYNILMRQLHEAIGLKLDKVNKHVYLTDLAGTVYRVDMDGKNKKKIYDEECAFSGIGLAYV
ncbi:3-hydroxyacyl-CoA dehydrogenase-like protein [Halenospora varia]|nr:3-hydroxyacyl-CoA dehydrogenase-like protein [Halenospora varia]